ncbi:unnamed protein product [Toxocara canis]|uniref:Secreted protein n=1 Tax=Toxocara canis TaxID=6265 RepID=A0A183U1C5_TOXCA|nr:unnamed protein product [Toxocara canis]
MQPGAAAYAVYIVLLSVLLHSLKTPTFGTFIIPEKRLLVLTLIVSHTAKSEGLIMCEHGDNSKGLTRRLRSNLTSPV